VGDSRSSTDGRADGDRWRIGTIVSDLGGGSFNVRPIDDSAESDSIELTHHDGDGDIDGAVNATAGLLVVGADSIVEVHADAYDAAVLKLDIFRTADRLATLMAERDRSGDDNVDESEVTPPLLLIY
jgi:hypothetical protein